VNPEKTMYILFRAVFWVVLPCKMIVDRRFRGTCRRRRENLKSHMYILPVPVWGVLTPQLLYFRPSVISSKSSLTKKLFVSGIYYFVFSSCYSLHLCNSVLTRNLNAIWGVCAPLSGTRVFRFSKVVTLLRYVSR
jgi:hypothetical protein